MNQTVRVISFRVLSYLRRKNVWPHETNTLSVWESAPLHFNVWTIRAIFTNRHTNFTPPVANPSVWRKPK